mmetsp:Transcript_72576/g.106371  ORF Transcript_72576/g.106371 Transcript_72576/m.106371 type:complete len:228 (+) Transcript_72576:352-1035(+)
MVVVGLAWSLVSTAGFGFANFADLYLGVPCAIEYPELGRFLGRWVMLTFQTNVFCLGYSLLCTGLCTAAATWPSRELDEWVVRLFPLYFMLALFLTAGYYTTVHFNKSSRDGRKFFAENGYPYIILSKHASHGHATALALMMSAVLNEAPSVRHVIFSTGPFLLEYLLLTCLNYRLTGKWMYPFLDDAAKKNGVRGVALVMLIIIAIGAICGLFGKIIIDFRLHYWS